MPEQENRKLFYTEAERLAEEKRQMEALLAQGSQFSTEKGTQINEGMKGPGAILPPGEGEKVLLETGMGVLGNLFNSAGSKLQGVLGERNEEFQKYNEKMDAYNQIDNKILGSNNPDKLKHPGNRPLEGPLDKHGHYESFEFGWPDDTPDWIKSVGGKVGEAFMKNGELAARAVYNELYNK